MPALRSRIRAEGRLIASAAYEASGWMSTLEKVNPILRPLWQRVLLLPFVAIFLSLFLCLWVLVTACMYIGRWIVRFLEILGPPWRMD